MRDHEPSFWGDVGPRYSHVPPGAGAHEMADHLAVSGTPPGDPRMTAASRWRRGAVGEEAVGRLLDRLPRPDWAVVHDLTIGSGGANLDHLVIGPPRVYTVNTKHLSGDVAVHGRSVLVAGRRRPYLPKALAEAERVGTALRAATGIDAFVWPVLVFHGCTVTVKEHPSDVTVLHSSQALDWFAGQRSTVLTPGQTVALETAARASTTWPSPPLAVAEQAERLARLARARAHAQTAATDRTSEARPVSASAATSQPTQLAPTHTVARWCRFGKDRWYVNDSDGDAVGHLDVVTGIITCVRDEDEVLVRAALVREGVID